MALDPRIALGVQPMHIQSPMQGAQQALTLRDLMESANMRGMQRDALIRQQQAAEQQQAARGQFLKALQTTGGKLTPEMVPLGLAAGFDPAKMQSLASANDWGKPKVASWQEIRMPNGEPGVVPMDDQGRQMGPPVPKAVQARFVDTGGEQKGLNPYTGQSLFAMKKTVSPDSQLSASTAMRGQNMSAATARRGQDLTHEAAMWQQQHPSMTVTQTDQGTFQVPNRGGTAVPVIGQDGKMLGGKPLSESQANSYMYGSRMAHSGNILNEIESDLSPSEIAQLSAYEAAKGAWVVGGGLGAHGNKMLSPKLQQYEQAKLDFTTAKLRKESGATISKEEFSKDDSTFFPQVGDSPSTIEQKRQARLGVIKGIAAGAGGRQADILKAIGEAEFNRRKAAKSGGNSAEGNISQPSGGWSAVKVQ